METLEIDIQKLIANWEEYGMNWLLAYLLLLIIIILLFWVGFKKDVTWGSRIKGWTLLILPIPLYLLITGYFTAYYQHVRDCSADSGLKVFIQPEKVDRVRVNNHDTTCNELDAKGILFASYPKLKVVEATGCNKSLRADGLYSFSVASTNNSKFFNDWTFDKTPITKPNSDVYLITQSREEARSRNVVSKYEWKLSRNDKLYAKVTNYLHIWKGIQYPDAVPFWSCWDDQSEKYSQPEVFLIKLILR